MSLPPDRAHLHLHVASAPSHAHLQHTVDAWIAIDVPVGLLGLRPSSLVADKLGSSTLDLAVHRSCPMYNSIHALETFAIGSQPLNHLLYQDGAATEEGLVPGCANKKVLQELSILLLTRTCSKTVSM